MSRNRNRRHDVHISRRLAALLLVVALVATACGGGSNGAEDGWPGDLDVLLAELPSRHVDAFHTTDQAAWEAEVASARSGADGWSDEQGFFALSRLVALVGDGHTAVLWPKPLERYPFAVSRFSDGLFVTATSFDNRDLLGGRLLAVDGVPVSDILASGTAFVSGDTDDARQLRVADVINAPGLLIAADLERPDPGTITVESGPRTVVRPVEASVTALNTVGQDPDRVPLLIEDRPGSPYWSVDITEADAIYVNYRQAVEAPDLSMEDFASFITDSADRIGATRLVIDLRQNGGGNSTVLDPMIEALRNHPLGDDVVVLIGQRTFSSAVLNAIALRDELGAVLVGQPAASAASHFGEVETFTLPASGAVIAYSVTYFDRGETGALMPDVEVAFTGEDYETSTDPQLDAALNLER